MLGRQHMLRTVTGLALRQTESPRCFFTRGSRHVGGQTLRGKQHPPSPEEGSIHTAGTAASVELGRYSPLP